MHTPSSFKGSQLGFQRGNMASVVGSLDSDQMEDFFLVSVSMFVCVCLIKGMGHKGLRPLLRPC